MKRVCRKCEAEKELSEFYLKKNGIPKSSYCKICYCETYKREYDKEYYENNKELFKENYKIWIEKNDRTEYQKQYRENNAGDISKKQKEFRENNKELVAHRKKKYWDSLSEEKKKEINERKKEIYHEKKDQYHDMKNRYFKKRVSSDPLYKLRLNIRSLILNAFRRKFTFKSKKTIEILGCSFEEFYKHLESQFDEKMNWENQGSYWHMDHIKPISLAQNEQEVYELNHHTNFQPLYWEDNLNKSDKYEN